MRAVAQALGERQIEIASVVSLETGKTRIESIAEVQEAIDLIETYCAAIEEAEGFSAPLASLTASEQQLRDAQALRNVRRDRAVQFSLCAGGKHALSGSDRR